ncbi:MAG: hypothetical protein QOG52_502 [Frankiaceae bacterium]|nr:hypothetical protein [Frankiaceae bacterium]
MGAWVSGQAINVELQSAASSAAQPISVTGLAGAVSGGTSGAWLVTGTVTTGVGGTVSFTAAASVPSSVVVRAYVGAAPFNGSQPSNTATLFTSGSTGNAAVFSLSASPLTAPQAVGAGQSATVRAYDVLGGSVAGAFPSAFVTGANAGAITTCSITDLTGLTTCTYSNPNAGSDTLTVYVNLPTGMGPFYEPGEPAVRVTRISQAPALPPTVTVPANITRSVRVGRPGETVRFAATATDPIDGALTPTCLPPSGTLFPAGITTVTCSATNSHGLTASATFTITVLVRV